MIHVSAAEHAELKQTVSVLGEILTTLDQLGAGIAAIHIDAAINQLKKNLDAVEEQNAWAAFGKDACPSEHPVGLR